ncbi:hypothetical protein U5817_17335 [Aromatoleum evansii]|uniref:NERD domain-containing protein n=1 Tax=Aromatoleum evansii TaxID=59406 RepID=A0ABZ1AGG5_AROEV|nr:hypothetical protein U5817_17335 [Aromatoleum evansii]
MTAMPWDKAKLSEKTLELNFASQLNHACGGNLLWFGLTQKQEAKQGFDIATRIGKGLFIVQMKASAHVLQSGERQFKAPHEQLENLRKLTVQGGGTIQKGSIYYAFPVIGTLPELSDYHSVLTNTWLCDVADIPALGVPTTSNGTPRKDGNHYVRVSPGSAPLDSSKPGTATFHSDPVHVEVVNGEKFVHVISREGAARGLLENMTHNQFRRFWKLCQHFHRKAFAVAFVE